MPLKIRKIAPRKNDPTRNRFEDWIFETKDSMISMSLQVTLNEGVISNLLLINPYGSKVVDRDAFEAFFQQMPCKGTYFTRKE